MVKVTIIGWYGTETIGDRAILAGIFEILGNVYTDFEIKIGSIYPSLTERTLIEDMNFYTKYTVLEKKSISVYNSSRIKELDEAIEWSDIVIVGGGPLMDTDPIYMLEYAFKKAKKNRKKTILMGCGMGPLSKQKYISSVLSIIAHSDLIIFRDDISIETYNNLCKNNKRSVCASVDPAVFAAISFLNAQTLSPGENIVTINFREIMADVYAGVSTTDIESKLIDLVRVIADSTHQEICLVPMHTFTVGGDDRVLLNRIAGMVKNDRVIVQNKPLSLEQTMNVYYHSEFCIGMRFHAILLQTILNGKNYILDYTDPQRGKTIGLLKQLNVLDFYYERYYSMFDNGKPLTFDALRLKKYTVDMKQLADYKEIYINAIKGV